MRSIHFVFILIFCVSSNAQNKFSAVIKDSESAEGIYNVNVSAEIPNIIAFSDSSGRLQINGLPDGDLTFMFKCTGYHTLKKTFKFPLQKPEFTVEILMEPLHIETEEIVITTTRLSRDINDIPTRVEIISKEEIEEKINMEPANVVMLLNESTGIRTQQTSATTAASNIKIQGLDGRYTQILKDGFPLYGGFSEGLSIMQITPLDLKQVEVIKGPSSTLFGGGAIAGVINFVSIEPENNDLLSGLINVESFGGFDISLFYAGKKGSVGMTTLAALNYNYFYDVNKDDFTDIPRTKSVTFSPKLFLYPDKKTILKVGISATYEDRFGGDVTLIRNEADTLHRYFEENLSGRYNLTFHLERHSKKGDIFTLKGSAGLFSRKIKESDYMFEGKQYSTYSEASYLYNPGNHHVVAGLNFISENFREKMIISPTLRDYDHYTGGLFIQDTWDVSKGFAMETGIRYDYQNKYGSFLLPRATVFVKPSENVSSRLTGGLGYEIPNVFNEESENIGLENLQPVGDEISAETSIGASLDINYKTILFDDLSFSINQLFYFTRIKSPLELITDISSGALSYVNSNGVLESMGFETNVRLTFEPLKLFAGYTFTDAASNESGDRKSLPVTPMHNMGIVLIYEKHGDFRVGYEVYYTGKQYLSDNSNTPSYWVMGLMGQKNFGNVVLFLNLENFTDTRQSRYGPVVYSSHSEPLFREIWTHTEGFYINGGIKLNLF